MQQKVAHLFPAFVLKYTGKELKILEKHGYDFKAKLIQSEEILGIDIQDFDLKTNNFNNDEFINQILSYIFCCSFSDILRKGHAQPNYISGFSMGLYAALYHAKAIEFETGILLIKEVFYQVKTLLKNKNYVMASVIGFLKNDIKLFAKNYKSVEIVIKNGEYSFVIAGKTNEINSLMQVLTEEGAIHLSLFNVAYPYHSSILNSNTKEFEAITNKYDFNSPKIPIISMVDQSILSTSDAIEKEIVRNVTQPLNFLKTIQTLNKLEVKQFIEIGADTSLLKSSKFIDGEFEFKAVAKGKVI